MFHGSESHARWTRAIAGDRATGATGEPAASSPTLVDDVIVTILDRLHHADDLLACALINRQWLRLSAPLLAKPRRLLPRECTIVLLGQERSGKSTLVKHFTQSAAVRMAEPEQFQERGPIVKAYALSLASELLSDLRARGVELDESMERIVQRDHQDPHFGHESQAAAWLSVTEAAQVQRLWQEHGGRGDGGGLMHAGGLAYFMGELTRLSHPEYQPTLQDWLRLRVRTHGIVENTFDFGLHSHITVLDKGRGGPRRKWMGIFHEADVLLYVAALDAYDDYDWGGLDDNMMLGSMEMFGQLCASRWFPPCITIILVLNKVDRLAMKLPHSPLSALFPEYTAGADIEAAVEHIQSKYLEQAALHSRHVRVRVTSALDPESVGQLWPYGILEDHAANREAFLGTKSCCWKRSAQAVAGLRWPCKSCLGD